MNDHKVKELLDEESLAVLGIILAVSLEFGFGGSATGRFERPRSAESAR